jgi:GMP synthase-like glutamine amidotransferase
MIERYALVLQHAAPEGPGLIGQALAAKEIGAKIVRVDHGQPVPESMDGHAGLIVMGGPQSVYDGAPHLEAEKRLILDAIAKRRPVLGVCLGAQLLASALGAKVAPGPRKEIGWKPVKVREEARDDALFHDAGPRFTPLHWHGDVFELPKDATPLASSDLTEHQAFRKGKAWGLLFHVEVTRAMVEEFVNLFKAEWAAAGTTGEAILLDTARHLGAAADVGAKFFRRWVRLL